MKKLILTLSALIVSFGVSFAQSSEVSSVDLKEDVSAQQDSLFINAKFNKNWEFGLMVGAQAYLAEYMRFNSSTIFKCKDWWQPSLDLYFQKWASPMFGIGVGVNVAGFSGIYSSGDTKAIFRKDGVDKLYGESKNFYRANGAYGNIFAKATFNILNIFGGYNPKRIFEWTGYLGGGVVLPLSKCNYYSLGASFNAGLDFKWKLSRNWLIGFAVRGALISDGFNGISYVSSGDVKNIPLDGMIGATAGISYKFGYGQRKMLKTGEVVSYEWVPETVAMASSIAVAKEIDEAVKSAEGLKEAELLALKEKDAKLISELQSKNSELEAKLLAAQAPKAKKYWAHVNFKINKWDISKAEKVNILAAAEYIKSCPEQKFIIHGYADKQTATPDHNKKLSTNRADAVRNMLVNEFGVNPEQLLIEYHGGVDYMFFDEAQCSRSVIICSQE